MKKTNLRLLEQAAITAFIATADSERSKAFYRDTLGLQLVSEDQFAVVFDCRRRSTSHAESRQAETAPVHGSRLARGRHPANRVGAVGALAWSSNATRFMEQDELANLEGTKRREGGVVPGSRRQPAFAHRASPIVEPPASGQSPPSSRDGKRGLSTPGWRPGYAPALCSHLILLPRPVPISRRGARARGRRSTRGRARSSRGISIRRPALRSGSITRRSWDSIRGGTSRTSTTCRNSRLLKTNGCAVDRCSDGFQRPRRKADLSCSKRAARQAFPRRASRSRTSGPITSCSARRSRTNTFRAARTG